MPPQTIEFDDFDLSLEDGWEDVTADQSDPDSPFTFLHECQVGVLQISTAIYKSGKKPNVAVQDLHQMLMQAASAHGLASPTNLRHSGDPVATAAGDFLSQDEFVRMWYISDGWNFAKATYICPLREVSEELQEAEQIVKSLRFKSRERSNST